MKISILSNVNMNSLIRKLNKTHSVLEVDGYNTWAQELLNEDSAFHEFDPVALFLLFDGNELLGDTENYDEIRNAVDQYSAYIESALSKKPNTYFFISNIDIPKKRIKSLKEERFEWQGEFLWQQRISDISKEYENALIFDLKNMVSETGRNSFYSQKMWYLAGMKFSAAAETKLSTEIDRCIGTIKGNKKKCLILDLDNTLWGGIIGEDLIDGIELGDHGTGARYRDFQKRIKELKELGVLLAIASKNNLDDALEVFRKCEQMILKEEDFACIKVNWNLKAQNVIDIQKELNIGTDSFVFIDDNQVERDSLRNEIPELEVPDFPADTSELERFIIEIYENFFYSIRATSEDRQKTQLYRENIQREAAKTTSASFENFLKSLNTRIVIGEATESEAERVSQLTQKTNQFNLTTKRYTKPEISNLIDSKGHHVYCISVSDKYGESGIIGVVILEEAEERIVMIDTFLQSCRVMGRFIEDDVLSWLEEKMQELGFTRIESRYSPTKKNAPVKNLFERLGYELVKIDEDGSKQYVLEIPRCDKGERKSFAEVLQK